MKPIQRMSRTPRSVLEKPVQVFDDGSVIVVSPDSEQRNLHYDVDGTGWQGRSIPNTSIGRSELGTLSSSIGPCRTSTTKGGAVIGCGAPPPPPPPPPHLLFCARRHHAAGDGFSDDGDGFSDDDDGARDRFAMGVETGLGAPRDGVRVAADEEEEEEEEPARPPAQPPARPPARPPAQPPARPLARQPQARPPDEPPARPEEEEEEEEAANDDDDDDEPPVVMFHALGGRPVGADAADAHRLEDARAQSILETLDAIGLDPPLRAGSVIVEANTVAVDDGGAQAAAAFVASSLADPAEALVDEFLVGPSRVEEQPAAAAAAAATAKAKAPAAPAPAASPPSAASPTAASTPPPADASTLEAREDEGAGGADAPGGGEETAEEGEEEDEEMNRVQLSALSEPTRLQLSRERVAHRAAQEKLIEEVKKNHVETQNMREGERWCGRTAEEPASLFDEVSETTSHSLPPQQ